VGRVPAAKNAAVVEFADLPAFGPYLQVRTTLTAAQAPPPPPTTTTGDTPAPAPTATPPVRPTHRVSVRLVSDGPFTVVPA